MDMDMDMDIEIETDIYMHVTDDVTAKLESCPLLRPDECACLRACVRVCVTLAHSRCFHRGALYRCTGPNVLLFRHALEHSSKSLIRVTHPSHSSGSLIRVSHPSLSSRLVAAGALFSLPASESRT